MCCSILEGIHRLFIPVAEPLTVVRVTVTGTWFLPCFTSVRVATRSVSFSLTSRRSNVITTTTVCVCVWYVYVCVWGGVCGCVYMCVCVCVYSVCVCVLKFQAKLRTV